MKYTNNQRSMSAVAALLVLAVFAVSILGVLLGGAGIYQRLVSRTDDAYDSRTCVQYLASKVRQAPAEVTLASFGEGMALVIPQVYGEKEYLTRIYCYQGWLMELFCAADGNFAPEDGEKILPVEALALSIDDGLLVAQIQTAGEKAVQLKLDLREVVS